MTRPTLAQLIREARRLCRPGMFTLKECVVGIDERMWFAIRDRGAPFVGSMGSTPRAAVAKLVGKLKETNR